MPLSVRAWNCEVCGAVHDRDVNAALNILAVGQIALARGGVGKTGIFVAEEPNDYGLKVHRFVLN